MALAMKQGGVALTLEEGKKQKLGDHLRKAEGEIDRLKGAVMTLAFEPLTNGVRTAAEALHILGFPPEMRPDQKRSDPGIECWRRHIIQIAASAITSA